MLKTLTRRRDPQRPHAAPASISSPIGTGLSARIRRSAGATAASRVVESAPAAKAMGWTPGAAHGAGLVRLVLVLALAAGPAALVLQQLNPTHALPLTAQASSQPDPSDVAAVGNFAAEFVTAWLTTPAGAEQTLSFYVQNTASLRLAQTVPRVQNVAVADVERISAYSPSADSASADPDSAPTSTTTATATATSQGPAAAAAAGAAGLAPMTWKATVAADVEEPGADGARVMVRRYFAVPVLARPASGASVSQAGQGSPVHQMRALLLPQPVAGPASGEGAELDYAQQVSPTSSLFTSLGQFLTAYAAGSGDVTRYVTPGAPIVAIAPAAYAGVELQSVLAQEGDPTSDEPADGQRAQVLVTATFTTLDQQKITSQYALDLTARGGRWEVSTLAQTPALVQPVAAVNAPSAPSAGADSAPAGGSPARQ